MKALKKGPKKLPKFRTAEDEIRFFETHDMAPYWDQLEKVDEMIELAPELTRRIQARMRKRLLAIRLEEWQITRAKEIARKKGIPYQTLMRQWIGTGIRRENTRGIQLGQKTGTNGRKRTAEGWAPTT